MTSASIASSYALPVSPTMVRAIRSALSTTQRCMRRSAAPRPSNPSACQPGCASRARATSAATCGAASSSTSAICAPDTGSRTAITTVLRRERQGLDADVLDRLVAPVGLGALDAVDDVHALRHLAEHRVLAVEPRGGVDRDDEELRPVRVRPRVGHRELAALDLVLVDLVLERVAGTTGAGALRAAALDHEVLDHPVEDQPVVEALVGEVLEVAHGLRSVLVEELEGHGPLAGVHGHCGHGYPLRTMRSEMDARGSSGRAGVVTHSRMWRTGPFNFVSGMVCFSLTAGMSRTCCHASLVTDFGALCLAA